jgi:hypothetical protein
VSNSILASAYHEASHAVVACHLRIAPRFATILSSGGRGGRVVHHSPLRGIRLDLDNWGHAQAQVERCIMVYLAGPLGQRRSGFRTRARWWGGEHDYIEAVNLALRISGSIHEAEALLKTLDAKARRIINRRWRDIGRVAHALFVRRVLSGREIVALVNVGPFAGTDQARRKVVGRAERRARRHTRFPAWSKEPAASDQWERFNGCREI